MYSKELEELISAAIADGVITDKERTVIRNRAEREGVDSDEVDVYIDGLLEKNATVYSRSNFIDVENTGEETKPQINVEVNNKPSVNKNVLGWLVLAVVLVILTYILHEVLYKTGFSLYTFFVGLFTGFILHKKLYKHD